MPIIVLMTRYKANFCRQRIWLAYLHVSLCMFLFLCMCTFLCASFRMCCVSILHNNQKSCDSRCLYTINLRVYNSCSSECHDQCQFCHSGTNYHLSLIYRPYHRYIWSKTMHFHAIMAIWLLLLPRRRPTSTKFIGKYRRFWRKSWTNNNSVAMSNDIPCMPTNGTWEWFAICDQKEWCFVQSEYWDMGIAIESCASECECRYLEYWKTPLCGLLHTDVQCPLKVNMMHLYYNCLSQKQRLHLYHIHYSY